MANGEGTVGTLEEELKETAGWLSFFLLLPILFKR